VNLIYPMLNRAAHDRLEVHGQAMDCAAVARGIGLEAAGTPALLARILDGRFRFQEDTIGLWSWDRPFPPPGETIVALDLEATNGDPLREEIIEIGAVKISRHANGTVVLEEFSVFNDPKRPISPYVQTLTGISPEMLRGAPPLEKSLLELLEFVRGATLVIQNAPFDLAFLLPRFAKLGCELTNTVVDTLDLARQTLPGRRRRGLDALGQIYGVPIEDRHRALGDARATLHIAQALYFALTAGRETTLAELHRTITETQARSGNPSKLDPSKLERGRTSKTASSELASEPTEKPNGNHPKRTRKSRKLRSLGPLEEVPA
jgi:DNA polymerase III subunit epsilon